MLRSGIDIVCSSVSEFAWIYWIKSQITSNKIVCVSTEVRIWHLPKTTQKIWCFIHFSCWIKLKTDMSWHICWVYFRKSPKSKK